jgi:hypothetical protein
VDILWPVICAHQFVAMAIDWLLNNAMMAIRQIMMVVQTLVLFKVDIIALKMSIIEAFAQLASVIV